MWKAARRDHVIDDEQYQRFQRAVETLYDTYDVGGRTVYQGGR